MPERVGDRLPHDPQHVVADREGQRRRNAAEMEMDRNGRHGSPGRQLRGQGLAESRGGESGVTQVPDEHPGLFLQAGDQFPLPIEHPAGLGVGHAAGGCVESQREPGELLLERVVKLPGDPLPLLDDGVVVQRLFDDLQLPSDLAPQRNDPHPGH